MNKKVWVIGDSTEKQVSIPAINKSIPSAIQQKSTKGSNPSLAYSLSIIIWGCGQFYNRQWKLGIMFLLFMINFFLFMRIFITYWEPVQSLSESIGIDFSIIILMVACFSLLGLIVWYFNAWQAYFKNTKINPGTHKGIRIALLPAFCSLLVPGWGQLLNGQTKKGLFFQVFAFTALATFSFHLFIFLVWPVLEASRSRLIIEWIFSISIILLPFIFIIWILNVFDAAKVSINHTKKEPLPIRIKYAANRFRMHTQMYGWKNTLVPIIKRKTLAVLLVFFCIITCPYVPKEFYMQQLHNLGNRMSEKQMTVLPAIIKKLTNVVRLDK
jgi:hypothetical protein